ncbi:GH39 family glycosyl hydrolase [Saccharicrinis sp. GN24d3]|uniref:GH39 family glycosyl hydrolase n=1 Tax=Saccharicrinis sp. GN24d3 TaxID=3458416 RepID=UPI0040366944
MQLKNIFILIVMVLTQLVSAQNNVTISATSEGETFDHFWSKCVGAGRANEALRAGWLEQLELVHQTCGFETVRFHGLFHDDMFPIVTERGKTTYNWQYIDDVFDRMLELDVRPFVELSYFPKTMAAENSQTVFWWKAYTTPGEGYLGKWHDLVKAFTQHCVDRYGMDEVRTWYFEVWNEPNLCRAFFDGTKSQYFDLYKASVKAVRSVDSLLKVGGPSTSNFVADDRYKGEREDTKGFTKTFTAENINDLAWRGVWIEDFLEYCKKENLPVDFVTTHPYPTDYPLDPRTGKGKDFSRFVNSTMIDIKWLNEVIANSAYPDAEIHLTEWNTSPNSRDAMHDFLPPAAYITKVNLDCIGLTNSLAFWTFTDIFEEKGGGASIFHGGFGMINYQGLVKPTYHAYKMLHQLGDEKLFKNDFLFVSRKSGNGKVVALAYNYPEDHYQAVPASIKKIEKYEEGKSRQLNVTMTDLKPGTQFKIETLDKDHGNIYNYWEKMGKPEPPTREQIKVMKDYANNLKTEIIIADKDGKLTINREIAAWNVLLIQQIN